MKETPYIIGAMVLVAFVATTGYFISELDNAQDRIAELEQELSSTGSQLSLCDLMQEEQALTIDELRTELEECQHQAEDNEYQANDQAENNWHLQNDNYDLEYRIRSLENDLEDCEDRLRDCQ